MSEKTFQRNKNNTHKQKHRIKLHIYVIYVNIKSFCYYKRTVLTKLIYQLIHLEKNVIIPDKEEYWKIFPNNTALIYKHFSHLSNKFSYISHFSFV